jgi:hypothetical protein
VAAHTGREELPGRVASPTRCRARGERSRIRGQRTCFLADDRRTHHPVPRGPLASQLPRPHAGAPQSSTAVYRPGASRGVRSIPQRHGRGHARREAAGDRDDRNGARGDRRDADKSRCGRDRADDREVDSGSAAVAYREQRESRTWRRTRISSSLRSDERKRSNTSAITRPNNAYSNGPSSDR